MQPLIIIGERTFHGGVVIDGSPETDVNGKSVVRVGNRATSWPATRRIRQTMGTNALSVAPFLLAAAVCSASTAGIVKMNIGTEARLYTTSPLSSHEFVHFQYPDKTGATRCCLRRASASFQLIEPDPAASDSLAGNPVFSYRLLNLPRLDSKTPFLGAAVVGHALVVQQSNAETLTIRSRTGRLTVTTCTSQEGLHAVSKAGTEIIADLYFGFDYDVEHPTCPSK